MQVLFLFPSWLCYGCDTVLQHDIWELSPYSREGSSVPSTPVEEGVVRTTAKFSENVLGVCTKLAYTTDDAAFLECVFLWSAVHTVRVLRIFAVRVPALPFRIALYCPVFPQYCTGFAVHELNTLFTEFVRQ